MLRTIFVYGTLRPGEVRWHHLAPFVGDDPGVDARVDGAVFDTGRGYPAARFEGPGTIVGRRFELLDPDLALAHLDEVEGAVAGLYHRVVVRTHDGTDAWAYECGDDSLLVQRIASGDWCQVSDTGSWG